MKKITFLSFALLAGLSMAFTACEAKNETGGKKTESYIGTIYKDTVRLMTAQTNIGNYVRICDRYMGDKVPIRSYSINKADLFGMLGVTAVPDSRFEHCRVYLGMDSLSKFKLYMTPTVKVPSTPGAADSVFVDKIPYDSIHRTYFVYDLNAPCPSTCDKGSRLYVPSR